MFKKYLITHKCERILNIKREIVIENYLDFDHVNFIHKKCYKYCKVIKRLKNITFLKYGVYHIPPIPFVSHYEMKHEFHKPDKILHYSKKPGNNEIVMGEVYFEDLGNKTKITQFHKFKLPIIFKPLEKLIIFLVNRWSKILWEEDKNMMEHREEFIFSGNKDGLHCGKWLKHNGEVNWVFNKKKK